MLLVALLPGWEVQANKKEKKKGEGKEKKESVAELKEFVY